MKLRLLLAFILLAPFARGQGTLLTVQNNGPRAKRINIVFLSEGYTAASMPNFAGHVTNAVNYLFSREPWQQYRSYCNVFRIEIPSVQDGCDNGSAGGSRNTYFSTGFNTAGIPQLLTLEGNGSTLAYNLLNVHVPEYHIPIVLVNDTKYGGSGGPISVASVDSSSAQVVEHEVGHSFAGLADEYDVEYPQYTPAEQPNNTAQTTRALIRWNAWIAASTPVPTPETSTYDALPGLFEGSMYRTTGWYRPHLNSLMRNLNRPVGQINREQFVISYYNRIDPIDAWLPSLATFLITSPQSIPFSVTPKTPSVGSLATQWLIDNVVQSGATSNSFNILSDFLGNGTHTVKARVTDPTSFVRNDPGLVLRQDITWTITLSNQLPVTLAAWRTAYGADLANPSGDGFKNLVKYALAISPAKPISSSEQPTAGLTNLSGNNYLTLTVPRRIRRTDIVYAGQVSSDLASWNTGAGHTVTILDSETMLIVRDALPIGANPRRAMRLQVTAP